MPIKELENLPPSTADPAALPYVDISAELNRLRPVDPEELMDEDVDLKRLASRVVARR